MMAIRKGEKIRNCELIINSTLVKKYKRITSIFPWKKIICSAFNSKVAKEKNMKKSQCEK